MHVRTLVVGRTMRWGNVRHGYPGNCSGASIRKTFYWGNLGTSKFRLNNSLAGGWPRRVSRILRSKFSSISSLKELGRGQYPVDKIFVKCLMKEYIFVVRLMLHVSCWRVGRYTRRFCSETSESWLNRTASGNGKMRNFESGTTFNFEKPATRRGIRSRKTIILKIRYPSKRIVGLKSWLMMKGEWLCTIQLYKCAENALNESDSIREWIKKKSVKDWRRLYLMRYENFVAAISFS